MLLFDTGAVGDHVEVVGPRRSLGRPVSQFDAQMAAIARRAGARLATRNLADFEHCGVALVDPWAEV